MSTLIILPTPLRSGSISLGQLITDPLQSQVASFVSSTKASNQRAKQTQNFRQTIVHDEYGHFVSDADAKNHAVQDNVLFVNAEQSSHISLVRSKATFNTLRKNATARSYLYDSALQDQPLYYVTSIQTLKNPSFKRAVIAPGNVAEAAGREIRLPSHVRRIDSAVGLDNTNIANEKNEESIFAVELLKVRCRVGMASEPHSVDDVDYEWTYHALDEDDEDKQLSIGLGKVVKASELRSRADTIDDNDYDDQSWSYGSDDEEGLGGF